MLGLRRRRRLLQPRPRLGVDLQEPEDGADEAAGVVRPEVRVGGAVRAAGGAAAGAAGALVVGVVGGGGAEEDGLVDLGLAERARQQGARRVALRRRQRRRHRFGRADEQSASSCWVSGGVCFETRRLWVGRFTWTAPAVFICCAPSCQHETVKFPAR